MRVRLEYLGESDVTHISSDYGLCARKGRGKGEEDDDGEGEHKENGDGGDREEEEEEEGGKEERKGPERSVYEVFNRRTFGLTEKDIVLDVHGCVQELLQKDREAERRGKRAAAAESRAKKKKKGGGGGGGGRNDEEEEEE